MKKLPFILLILQMSAFAQVPDPLPNTYVNDLTGKLSPDQIAKLNSTIAGIEKKSSVQIAVVLINSLPTGKTIEDYALETGRKWHVGNANNGLVYVAALADRKQHLAVASAMGATITDASALTLTDDVKPFFRAQDYYGGLAGLLNGIAKKLDPVLQQQLALAKVESDKKNDLQQHGNTLFILLGVLLGTVCIYIVYRIRRRQKYAVSTVLSNRILQDAKDEDERRDFALRMYNTGRLEKRPPPPSAFTKQASSVSGGSPIIIPVVDDAQTYNPPVSRPSDSSSSDSSSSYGNWGSGSSDSSPSMDSGFSGGGASNDW